MYLNMRKPQRQHSHRRTDICEDNARNRNAEGQRLLGEGKLSGELSHSANSTPRTSAPPENMYPKEY